MLLLRSWYLLLVLLLLLFRFFPGVLWQLHSLTGKQRWADLAQQWQADLAGRQRSWVAQRDLGEPPGL